MITSSAILYGIMLDAMGQVTRAEGRRRAIDGAPDPTPNVYTVSVSCVGGVVFVRW